MNYKYFLLYEEKRKGNYFFLLDLEDGSLIRASRLYNLNNFLSTSKEVTVLENNKRRDYLRVHPSELDSYDLSRGIHNLISHKIVKNLLFEKIKTSRLITPRVHKLDYLKGVLTTKEIREIKNLIRENNLVDFSNFSFNMLLKLERGILKSFSSVLISDKLYRFLFPITIDL